MSTDSNSPSSSLPPPPTSPPGSPPAKVPVAVEVKIDNASFEPDSDNAPGALHSDKKDVDNHDKGTLGYLRGTGIEKKQKVTVTRKDMVWTGTVTSGPKKDEKGDYWTFTVYRTEDKAMLAGAKLPIAETVTVTVTNPPPPPPPSSPPVVAYPQPNVVP